MSAAQVVMAFLFLLWPVQQVQVCLIIMLAAAVVMELVLA
jgi:hypothetical protein